MLEKQDVGKLFCPSTDPTSLIFFTLFVLHLGWVNFILDVYLHLYLAYTFFLFKFLSRTELYEKP